MPYRHAPIVAGLPLPRRHLRRHTLLAIVLSALAIALPLYAVLAVESHRHAGGIVAMCLLSIVALATASLIALLARQVTRGSRRAAAFVAALPGVPLAVGSVIAVVATSGRIDAARPRAGLVTTITGEDVRTLVATGLAEAANILLFAVLLSATAFTASAVALLGGVASIDRRRALREGAARPRARSRAKLVVQVIGAIGAVVAVLLHLTLDGALAAPVAAPVLLILTALASGAAERSALLREWHDPRERDTALSMLLAAAVAGSAGVVLLDVAAALVAERSALAMLRSGTVEVIRAAALTADTASHRRAALIAATCDGLFAFAVVTVGVVGALRRSISARPVVRVLLEAPTVAVLASVGVLAASTLGARVWTCRNVADVVGLAPTDVMGVELPAFGGAATAGAEGLVEATTMVVDAAGRVDVKLAHGTCSGVILVADRSASWWTLAPQLSNQLVQCEWLAEAPRRRLWIRVAQPTPANVRLVDVEGMLVAPDAYLPLSVASFSMISGETARDDVQAVVDRLSGAATKGAMLAGGLAISTDLQR